MSRLHTVALGAALLLGVSGIAGAQGQTQGKTQGQVHGQRGAGHEGRRGRDFGARMAKDLNLTDAQKTQIKAIHEKYRSQLESIRGQVRSQNGATPRVVPQRGDSARRGGFRNISPELRQRMLTLRTQEQAEIRNVLTAQQRVKFDAAQAQRKQRMENHKRGTNPRA